MDKTEVLAVSIIFLLGALVSPIPISFAQTNTGTGLDVFSVIDDETIKADNHTTNQDLDSHDLDSHDLDSHDLDSHDLDSHDLDSHDLDSHDLDSHDLDSVTSSSKSDVLSSNSLTAGEIIQFKLDSLDAKDITNLGLSIEEAEKVHKLLNDASKEERKNFKNIFHEYKTAVKLILKTGKGNFEKEFQDFSKKAIKIEKKIEKLEAKDEVKDKIKYEIKLSQKQRELQRIKNHLVTQENFLAPGTEKDKVLEELTELKKESYKNILLLKATKNGKVLNEKDLEKIDKEVDKKVSNFKDKKDKDSKVDSSEGKQSKDNKVKKDKDSKAKDKKEKKSKDKKEKKSKDKKEK